MRQLYGIVDDQHSAVQPAATVQNETGVPMLHSKNTSADAWGTGVIYFLFLLNDRLPHAAIWQQFFMDALPGSWKVLVHCQDSAGCKKNGVFSNNPGFMQVATVPTWYCHDLVTAMRQLLAEALKLNTLIMGGEKFVFLSESTLPVKPFAEVRSTLLLDDNSDFCLFPSDQWGSARVDGSFVNLVKHHQWVVLSRDHATLFVKQWVPVNNKSQWQVWLKSGKWQGHDRQIVPQQFSYPAIANTCTDEWAFMATIFGALEPQKGIRYLQGFGGGQIDMHAHISQGRCRTWTFWDKDWDPAAGALGLEIAKDNYDSQISCFPKCHARPATLEKMSQHSLKALRDSPFLFVRKFEETTWMPRFYNIVLRS